MERYDTHVLLSQTPGEFSGPTWLGFPIQTRMVKERMLTKEEKAWIKACH